MYVACSNLRLHSGVSPVSIGIMFSLRYFKFSAKSKLYQKMRRYINVVWYSKMNTVSTEMLCCMAW